MTTLSLSVTTTILLSVPATTGIWPGGNPSQSMNAVIRFTGAQTGSATIQFTLPGYYIVENKCTGTTFVKLSPASGGGNSIGAPPGQKVHVFFDGTDMDYVNMPTPGSALDLVTNTTTLPPWMTACSVAPYLLKDGTTYSTATYPALAQLLGSTYGGNGATTFGVPDESNRFRLAVATAGVSRITVAGSGVSGTTLGAAGGSQTTVLVTGNLPPYTPAGTISGTASIQSVTIVQGGGAAFTGYIVSGGTPTTLSVSGSLSGTAQGGVSTPFGNVPPCIVSFLPLVKT